MTFQLTNLDFTGKPFESAERVAPGKRADEALFAEDQLLAAGAESHLAAVAEGRAEVHEGVQQVGGIDVESSSSSRQIAVGGQSRLAFRKDSNVPAKVNVGVQEQPSIGEIVVAALSVTEQLPAESRLKRDRAKQSRARKGAVEGSQRLGAAIAMRSMPDWTAPLRARLCSEHALQADRLKGAGFRPGDGN